MKSYDTMVELKIAEQQRSSELIRKILTLLSCRQEVKYKAKLNAEATRYKGLLRKSSTHIKWNERMRLWSILTRPT